MKTIILAGGRGRRLEPYTTVLPKPLMPIGDMPILEIIVRQLRKEGFSQVILAVGYLGELIEAFLGDGKKYGLKISYSREEKSLSTMGPLSLIDGLEETFLVINGDTLTDLKYSELVKYHKGKGGIATLATYHRDVRIDFGVARYARDNRMNGFIEKPTYEYEVSMGIYVFEPEILRYIPKGKSLGFDELMTTVMENNEKVYCYPFDGYWLDIGRQEDYQRAVREFEEMKGRFL